MNRRTRMHIALTGACWVATAILIVLRASGAIRWPWWWIVAPLWAPIVVIMAGYVVLAVIERFRADSTHG